MVEEANSLGRESHKVEQEVESAKSFVISCEQESRKDGEYSGGP